MLQNITSFEKLESPTEPPTSVIGTSLDKIISSSLSSDEKEMLLCLLRILFSVFDSTITDYGKCVTTERRTYTGPKLITLSDNDRAAYVQPSEKNVEAHMVDMLSKGVIRPSSSA